MQCMRYVEPLNPSVECKYGFERNICNKTSCLKGPDETCYKESGMISENCADNLVCCGICHGCLPNECSQKLCDTNLNSIAAKRMSSKPLWFPDQQRLDEKRILQQLQQKLQQQEERQRLLMQSSRDFLNMKSSLDRLPFYPFINNIEYPSNIDD